MTDATKNWVDHDLVDVTPSPDPYFPYRVRHTPQECASNCEDRECPYTHKPSWDIFLRDVYCEGPFYSEDEAKTRAAQLRSELRPLDEEVVEGELLFRGWSKPWLVGAVDVGPLFRRVVEGLASRTVDKEFKIDYARIFASQNATSKLEFDNQFQGLGFSVYDTEGRPRAWTNLGAYLEITMQNLNGRFVKFSASSESVSIEPAYSEEDVPVLYRSLDSDGNSIEITVEHARKVCRLGSGSSTCIFLAASANNFECFKFDSHMARMLLGRELNARRIGNCRCAGLTDKDKARLAAMPTLAEVLEESRKRKLPEAGDRAVYLGKNGHRYQRDEANKVLEVGKEYVVSTAIIGDCSSRVELEGFENKMFNSVMFDFTSASSKEVACATES